MRRAEAAIQPDLRTINAILDTVRVHYGNTDSGLARALKVHPTTVWRWRQRAVSDDTPVMWLLVALYQHYPSSHSTPA